VVGSRRYRAFEERLISRETLKELERDGTLPIAVDADFERFISARRALLDERLAATDVKAKGGLLPDVMLNRGVLKITPIEKSTPPEAEPLAARLYAMLPRIRITDLLSEVAQWTLFTDCFTHLRTGGTATDPRILMASLLADGLNLGLTRMAEACTASLGTKSRGQPALKKRRAADAVAGDTRGDRAASSSTSRPRPARIICRAFTTRVWHAPLV
jgi:hypothetical protein